VIPLTNHPATEKPPVFRLGGMNKRLTRISKYLTFILRHAPQSIGLNLDADGFASVDELVSNANASGKSITVEQVHQVVAGHETPMFALSDDGQRIQAL